MIFHRHVVANSVDIIILLQSRPLLFQLRPQVAPLFLGEHVTMLQSNALVVLQV